MTARGAGQRTRRGLATAALVAAVALGAVVTAAAAQLGVASAGITTSSGTHSCPGTAAATASASPATSVQVTFPAACAGRPVSVVVLNGSTVVASGTATAAASGPTAVSVASFTPTASLTAASTVDGWVTTTTWSFTPPAPATCALTGDVLGWATIDGRWGPIIGPPSAPTACSVTSVSAGGSWTSGGRTYRPVEVTVRNTSSTEAIWRVTLDFAQSPFPGWTPKGIVGLGNGTGGTGWNARAAEGCGRLPLLDVVGNEGSTQTIAAGQSRTFQFQIVSGPAGDLVCP